MDTTTTAMPPVTNGLAAHARLGQFNAAFARAMASYLQWPRRQRQRRVFAALTGHVGGAVPSQYAVRVVALKRFCLELRPGLARAYAVGADAAQPAALSEPTGSRPAPGAVDVGAHLFGVWAWQLEPLGVDGSRSRPIDAETVVQSLPAAAHADQHGPPLAQAVRALSPREREVLSVLALGVTNRELAERLFISERTANRHLSNIFVKLGVRNRTQAARVAVAAGLG